MSNPKATWWPPHIQDSRNCECWQKFHRCKWEPVTHPKDQDQTYFNNPRKFEKKNQFDLYFAFNKFFPIYDQRKRRENCAALRDIRENIFHQESHKVVPALTSMNYGRRKKIETVERKYNRIDHLSSFYRRNGASPVIEKEVSSNSVPLDLN